MQKLNLAVIGVVNTGKSSFINSFVNKPISTVSLRRETFVPIKFTFDGLKGDSDQKYEVNLKNNRILKEKGELPELATKQVIIGKNLDLIESITDYPGLNDSNDKRDIFGHLVRNLHQYDLVIFVVKAEDALVQSSEAEIYVKLQKAVQENYDKGHYCKLIILVTKYDVHDEELGEIYEENIAKKKYEAFKWNSYNAIVQSYNCTEFKKEYTKEWNKVKSQGKKDELYDITGFNSFLKNESAKLQDNKFRCQFKFKSQIKSFSDLNNVIDYYVSKEISTRKFYDSLLLKRIRSYINICNIYDFDLDVIIKAYNFNIICLSDTVRFLKKKFECHSLYFYTDFLKKFDKSYDHLFENYCPGNFTIDVYIKTENFNIHLMDLFAQNYLKHQMKDVTIKKIEENICFLQKFIDLRDLIKNFILIPGNWWTIVYQKKKSIMFLFPQYFKEYYHLYDIEHIVKIPKERLMIIFNEPCLYTGYYNESYLSTGCTFCDNSTKKYLNHNNTYKYICDKCNPKIAPIDIFLRQKDFHNETDQIELINFICEKFDTPLHKIKNWVKNLKFEHIEETKKIRPLLKYQCWEFIQVLNIQHIYLKDIDYLKSLDTYLRLAGIDEKLAHSFGYHQIREYITFKYSHAFLKYCYEHINETIPQEKFLEFCEF